MALLGLLLVAVHVLAGEEAVGFPAHIQSKVELADHLSSYGYHRSALHYMKGIYRNEKLSPEQREKIKTRVAELESTLASSTPEQRLPDLEVMLHFDEPQKQTSISETVRTDTTSIENDSAMRPEEFPSNRIDKMKWLKRALIVAGCVWVGYRLHSILNPPDKEEPNSVTISF
jgi:hypothetical protein